MTGAPSDPPARSTEVDRLAEEFLARFRAGEWPQMGEYIRRHPHLEREIRDVFPTLLLMERVGRAGPPEPEPPPDTVGPYRVERLLGRGGQGEVWLAEDPRLRRKVALKVLPRDADPGGRMLERFRREAAVTARLEHPGICTVFEAGEDRGRPYFAMRWVDGESLAQWVEATRGSASSEGGDEGTRPDAPPAGADPDAAPMSAARVLGDVRTREGVMRVVEVGEKAARALHAAHQAGLIHRDIKPGNIMVTPAGEPVLLDFGLAREEEDDRVLTLTGTLMGTPAYMSPEQITAQRIPLDRRTDVYSLGATLYECLTLRLPFEAPTREGLYHRILVTEADDPRRLNASIPADLRTVLATAMEKDRDRRYQTAADLAEDLRRVRMHEPIRAKPPGPIARAARWCRRSPALAGSLAALFLALAGGLGLSLALLDAARQERDAKEDALSERHRAYEGMRAERDAKEVALGERGAALATATTERDAKEAALAEKEKALDRESDARIEAMAAASRATIALSRARVLGLLHASEAAQARDPMRALLLAREAARVETTPEAVELPNLEVREASISASVTISRGSVSPEVATRLHGALDASRERVAFRGHEGDVTSAAFSPAGDLVLTASRDGTLREWSLTARQVTTITDPVRGGFHGARYFVGGGILALTPSPGPLLYRPWGPDPPSFGGDARPTTAYAVSLREDLVVTAPRDGVVRAFDAQGRVRAEFHPHAADAVVTGVAISPAGDRVATASTDGTAVLLPMDGGASTVLRHEGQVATVAFSPRGDALLVAAWDDAAPVVLWSLDGKARLRLGAGLRVATWACFSPSGDRILAACGDRQARAWDLEGRLLATFPCHHGSTDSTPLVPHGGAPAAFSPSGDRVAVAGPHGTAQVRDAAGRLLADLRGHDGPVNTVAFSPDGEALLTSSRDGTARLWDLRGGEAGAFADAIHAVLDVSPARDRLLGVTADGALAAWDATGRRLATYEGVRFPHRAALSPTGDVAAATAVRPEVRVWDASGAPRATQAGFDGPVTAVRWSRDGSRLLLACQDTSARLLDAEGRTVLLLRTREAAAWSAGFLSEAGTPFLVEQGGAVQFHDAEGGPLGRNAPPPRSGPCWVSRAAPRGDLVATLAASGTVRLWDPVAGLRAEFEPGEGAKSAGILEFSASGDALLLACSDATVRVLDLAGAERARLRGHDDQVRAASFSPEGDAILTASDDGTARLWALDGEEIARFPHADAVTFASFLGDGSRIVTLSGERARLWLRDPDAVVRLADERITRPLSDRERETYADLLSAPTAEGK